MLTEKDYCDYSTNLSLWQLGCKFNPHYTKLTLYEAQKWLREEKNIDVLPRRGYINRQSYQVAIYINYNRSIVVLNNDGKDYNSLEEALSEGIKGTVKILKEK